jgi:hypothetical protein
MFAILMNELLDELVTESESWILPPSFIMAMNHILKKVLTAIQQFVFGIPHLFIVFKI